MRRALFGDRRRRIALGERSGGASRAENRESFGTFAGAIRRIARQARRCEADAEECLAWLLPRDKFEPFLNAPTQTQQRSETRMRAGVGAGAVRGSGEVALYTRMVIGSISTSCRRIMLYISGETLLMAPTAVATATTVEIHPPEYTPNNPRRH